MGKIPAFRVAVLSIVLITVASVAFLDSCAAGKAALASGEEGSATSAAPDSTGERKSKEEAETTSAPKPAAEPPAPSAPGTY